MRNILTLALLCAGSVAPAAAPPEVPAEVRGEVAAFVPVRAKSEGARVVFVAIDAGLNVFPADLLADKRATVVTSAKPGRYRLLCYGAVGGEPTDPAIVVVVIGDAPAPGPTPPKPPEPKPPAPEPESELVTKLRVAFREDAGNRDDLARLAALYRVGAELVVTPEVPHSAEMYRRLRAAAVSLAGALTATRTAVAAELSARLGAPNETPYTEAGRKTAAGVFNQIASALDAVSK